MDGMTTVKAASKPSAPSRRGSLKIAHMTITKVKNGFIAEHFKSEASTSTKGIRPPTKLFPERHVFTNAKPLADHVQKVFKPANGKGEKF